MINVTNNEIKVANVNETANDLLNKLLKQVEDQNEIISDLRKQVYKLSRRVVRLEKVNSTSLENRNHLIINENCQKIINLIDKNNLNEFKRTIQEVDYPIDDYLKKGTAHDYYNLLHYTIEFNHFDFATYLIESDANLNLPDLKDKWTPLMFAIEKQNASLVDLILSNDADLNTKDIDGFSPLEVAVDTQNKEIIQIILSYSPDVTNRRAVLAMAEPYKDKEIIRILKEYFEVNENIIKVQS